MITTGITSALLVGVGIGVLGRLAGPGRQRTGIVATVLLVVVAVLVGTAFARMIGTVEPEQRGLLPAMARLALHSSRRESSLP
jgi:uncharacterized membrane protein YeaQ/YmgE (transglycosylase-associated protein family)